MRQNNEERETGHVYSTVFQSSISTSIDKGEERRGEIQYPQKKKSKFSVPQTLLTDLVGWLNNPNPYSLQTHFPFPSSYSDDLLDKGL